MAYESARIILEEGIADFGRARRKAAERLGGVDRRFWPDNQEIQEVLGVQRQLFCQAGQDAELKRLQRQVLAAMRMFARFDPRLTGGLLANVAANDCDVTLHLHAETPEDVVLEMLEHGVPWQQRETLMRYPDGKEMRHPVLDFVAGNTLVHLVILPLVAQRCPPLSPITERPERGLDAGDVSRLLPESDAGP